MVCTLRTGLLLQLRCDCGCETLSTNLLLSLISNLWHGLHLFDLYTLQQSGNGMNWLFLLFSRGYRSSQQTEKRCKMCVKFAIKKPAGLTVQHFVMFRLSCIVHARMGTSAQQERFVFLFRKIQFSRKPKLAHRQH